MAGLKEPLQQLIDAYNQNPTAFHTNAALGHFMSEYRQLVCESVPFLVRAFQLAPTQADKRILMERLVIAYSNTGDEELGYQAAFSLYRSFPENPKYAEGYARRIERRGQVEEAARIYAQLIRRCNDNGEKIRRQRKEVRATQIIADANEILYAFGELGYRIDTYMKARALGMCPDVRAVLDATAFGNSAANQFLLECWRTQYPDQLHIVTDPAEMASLQEIYGAARLQPTLFRLPDGRAVYRGSGQNYVQQRWEDEGRAPLLKVPPDILQKGRKWLAGLGLPEEAWFVCLHARDGAFRDELPNSLNQFRNARVDKYAPLVAEIVRRGGWVIRIGNKSDIPMPTMPGLIDYTEATDREDWKDMFLLAECRFCVASNSGPAAVAVALGSPLLAVDWFPAGHYVGTKGASIVIHKLLRKAEDGRLLSIAETVAPPLGMAQSPVIYEKAGLEVVENDGQDIMAALAEMFELIEGRLQLSPGDSALQAAYAANCPIAQCGIGGIISPSFLARHSFLLPS